MSPNPPQHYSSCYLCGITNRSSGNVHILLFHFYVCPAHTNLPCSVFDCKCCSCAEYRERESKEELYCKWAPFQLGQSLYPTAAFSDFSKSSQSFSAKLHFTLSFYLHPLSFNKTLLFMRLYSVSLQSKSLRALLSYHLPA